MNTTSSPKVSFKKNSPTHYVLQYVKWKGGKADVTEAATLFRGKIQDKSKAKRSAKVLVKDGCLTIVSGDIHAVTIKGLEVLQHFVRTNPPRKEDRD